jgi:SAM-dependent methyltransferase
LDIGTGEGAFLDLARERGHYTAGIELSPSAAAAATAKGHAVYCGSVLDSRLGETGTYDIVTLWDVLEHIPEPRRALAAAFRFLTPGGTLALVTPMMGSVFDRAGVMALRLSGGRCHALARMCWSREHVFRFEPSGLVGALRSLGFQQVEAKPILLLSLRSDRYAGGHILLRWTRSPTINGAISRMGVAVARTIRISNKIFVAAMRPPE